MKIKILQTLLFLFFSFCLWSQNPSNLVIYGTVFGENDIPVANQEVFAFLNGNFITSDSTNNLGQYELVIFNGSVIGPNQVYTLAVNNCDNTQLIQTVSNQQGTVDGAVINFYTCIPSSFCHAAFTFSSNLPSGNTFFQNNSTISSNQGNVEYQWIVIANNTDTVATENSTNFDFSTPGQFYVCLNLTTSQGCTSSFCLPVTINSPEDTTTNCEANFSYTAIGNNTYQFQAIVDTNEVTEYFWEFDNGSTSTLANPTFTHLLNTTSITACLTIYTQNCEDTHCETFNIIPNSSGLSITGTLTGNPNGIISAIVYLYQLDSTALALNLIDTVYINSADYSYLFDGLQSGSYYVLAMPSQINVYAPTYYGNTLNWQDATTIVVNQNSVSGADIQLIFVNNPGGNGGVGGNVELGSGKINANGDFFRDINVIITKPNGTAVASKRLDSEGNFFIDNLAYGIYHIWAEKSGYNSLKTEFEISTQYPVATMTMEVSASGTLSMNMVEKMSEINLFPNPAQDQVQLSFESKESGNYQIQIINTLGQVVLNQTMNLGAGNQLVSINQLPSIAGIYQIILIKNGNQMATRKLMISK